MNNLLLLASKVSVKADEIQIKNPELSRADCVSLAFKECKNA